MFGLTSKALTLLRSCPARSPMAPGAAGLARAALPGTQETAEPAQNSFFRTKMWWCDSIPLWAQATSPCPGTRQCPSIFQGGGTASRGGRTASPLSLGPTAEVRAALPRALLRYCGRRLAQVSPQTQPKPSTRSCPLGGNKDHASTCNAWGLLGFPGGWGVYRVFLVSPAGIFKEVLLPAARPSAQALFSKTRGS